MKNVDNSLFYCSIPETDVTKEFISVFQNYSENNSKQVYIIDKALGTENEYSYDISDVAIIMIPKHPIQVLYYGINSSDLEDFVYDLKEDLGHISDKYEYSKILGRVRKWDAELFDYCNIDDFDIEKYLSKEVESTNIRKIDLLISLLIGSINDINKIGIDEPITTLDKVKRKIVLTDGQQSRFIYNKSNDKRVTIQGLAGTGKTELLLKKLKEVYIDKSEPIIAFTCFNKVLASELKNIRIPQFFNFMKVSEQIEWGTRLYAFSSWGNKNQPESGLISFICSKYGTTHKSYREVRNFELLCKEIRTELESRDDFKPCLDYMFIDESQDFGEEFFMLCEKITSKNVYIAGDIFQNIFDTHESSKDTSIDFLLNKCYRTDPRTLMFAHAVGMGLYENPKINWLQEEDWIKCGYTYSKNNGMIRLSRKPLRRFEDLDVQNTIKFVVSKEGEMVDAVIQQISDIVQENENATAEDIAIVILDYNYNRMCNYANQISYMIEDVFNWNSTRGYITKQTEKNSVYISNINNIKGLEFPFLICMLPTIVSNNLHSRNGIYTSLTRSFLTSYFIVNDVNKDFIETYQKALLQIKMGYIEVVEPSDKEKSDILTNIKQTVEKRRLTVQEIVDLLYAEFSLKGLDREFIESAVKRLYDKVQDDNELFEKATSICEKMIV